MTCKNTHIHIYLYGILQEEMHKRKYKEEKKLHQFSRHVLDIFSLQYFAEFTLFEFSHKMYAF